MCKTRNITCLHIILCVYTASHCVYHMILRVFFVYFQKLPIHSLKKCVSGVYTVYWEHILKIHREFSTVYFLCKKLFFMCNTQCNLHRVYTLLAKKHTPRIQHKYTVQLTSCIHTTRSTKHTKHHAKLEQSRNRSTSSPLAS